jgi:hypothetical protein
MEPGLCLGPRTTALDEVENRFVTHLAQHPGRVRQDPAVAWVGGLISAGKVDKNYESLARGNKNIPHPKYGRGVGTFLTIAPDALPLISDRSVMCYQIPLAQTSRPGFSGLYGTHTLQLCSEFFTFSSLELKNLGNQISAIFT